MGQDGVSSWHRPSQASLWSRGDYSWTLASAEEEDCLGSVEPWAEHRKGSKRVVDLPVFRNEKGKEKKKLYDKGSFSYCF